MQPPFCKAESKKEVLKQIQNKVRFEKAESGNKEYDLLWPRSVVIKRCIPASYLLKNNPKQDLVSNYDFSIHVLDKQKNEKLELFLFI